jgi:hypothetical protein
MDTYSGIDLGIFFCKLDRSPTRLQVDAGLRMRTNLAALLVQ